MAPTAGCLFCAIAAGEQPAHVVLDTPTVVAFLDHRPLFPGHTLVVPRAHVDTLADLPPADLPGFFTHLQLVESAVRAATGAAGSFVANNNVVSQSVPHLHFHVVPRNRKDGLRGFFWPRQRYEDDALAAAVAASIRASIREAVASGDTE